MKVGDVMECALLDKQNQKTGKYVPVEIRQISYGPLSAPLSARVKFKRNGKDAWIWVQVGMLREIKKVEVTP